MAAGNVGPTIALEGVKQYKMDLATATAATKAFKAELEKASRIKDPFEKVTKQSSALESEIKAQRERVMLLADAYGKAVQNYGEYSKQAFKAQEELTKAQKALDVMIDQYKGLSKEAIKIEGVGEFKRDIETLTQTTKTFKAEFQSIQSGFGIEGAFKRAADSSRTLNDAIKVQKENIKLLQEDYQRTVEEQGEFSQGAMEMREKIANATTELNNMEKTLRELPNGFQVAGQEIISFGDKWTQIGSDLQNAAKPFNMFTGAYTAAVGSAVKVSADYEQAMAKVQAVSGFTNEEMQALNDTLLDMTGESLYAPKELAEGLEVLGRAGIKDTNDQMKVLNAGLNLATAEGESFNTMADGLVNVLWMYGMGAEGAAEASDILAQASRSANTNVSYMFESLKYAGPSMAALKFDLKDTALALDLMADNGVRGSQAGTSLRQAMANLVSPTDTQTLAMKKFNISLDDGTGNAVSFSNFLGQIRNAFGGLDAEILGANGELKDADQLFDELSASLPVGELNKLQGVVDIFGKRALPGMLAMINSSDERFAELTAAMDGASGTAQEMADIVGDSATGAWTRFKNEALALGIEFGQTILPMLTEVLTTAKEWVSRFSEMDDGTKKFILTAGGIVALVGPILSGIGGVASGIGAITKSGGFLVSGIGKIVSLIGGGAAGGGLLASIGGVIAAAAPVIAIVAAVAAAAYLIYKNWDTIGPFLKKTWEGIKTNAENIFNAVKNFFVRTWEGIKTNAQNTWDAITYVLSRSWEGIKTFASNIYNGIKTFITGTWEGIKTNTSNTWNLIKTVITTVSNGIATAVKASFDNVKKWIETALNAAKTVAQNVFNTISNIVTKIKDAIKGVIDAALNWGRDLINNFVSGIKQKVRDVVDAVKGVADTVASYLHFSVPDKGPLKDADTYMPDFIRLLASGLRNGSGMLEAASSHLASAIAPDFYAELPETGGGTTTNMGGITIVINAGANDDIYDLADEVEDRISMLMERREAAYA